MRAIQIAKPGGPEVLGLADLPEPQPQAGQVVVQTTAIGVNFTDLFARMLPSDAPVVPGVEAVGAFLDDATGFIGCHLGAPAPLFRQWLSDLIDLCEQEAIRPHIDRVFPLDAAADAHRYLHERRNTGKVLLQP